MRNTINFYKCMSLFINVNNFFINFYFKISNFILVHSILIDDTNQQKQGKIKLSFICIRYLLVYKQMLDLHFKFLKSKLNAAFKNEAITLIIIIVVNFICHLIFIFNFY